MDDVGVKRYLVQYNDRSNRINWAPIEDKCIQEIVISPDETPVRTTPRSAIRGNTVLFESGADRYYIKVDIVTKEVTLECEEAFNAVSHLKVASCFNFSVHCYFSVFSV